MYYWTVQKFICVGRRRSRRRWPKVIFGFILFTICLFFGEKVESNSGWSFWINGPRSGLIITSAIITFIYQAFGSLGPPRGPCRSQGMSTNKRPPACLLPCLDLGRPLSPKRRSGSPIGKLSSCRGDAS